MHRKGELFGIAQMQQAIGNGNRKWAMDNRQSNYQLHE